ncbi:MAG: NAD(P)H-dependent glycerol-3-phosphate dehydrogenase [Pseudomonadota bacterium]
MTGIVVLGAGAFGTALGIALSADGTPVTLWGRNVDALRSSRASDRLEGVRIPEHLEVTNRLPAEDTVLLAVPMQALGQFLDDHATSLNGKTLVACCKGVDRQSGLGPVALIERRFPEVTAAILTGPSFAIDIARGLPTALTVACRDISAAQRLQLALSREPLRLYATNDVVGAELGGALKNVIAIAAGIVIGAGFGESARAALIARGFAELQRIATASGARPETLAGLSGLGDLVLTSTSEKSRNLRAGLALGAGDLLPQGETIEGVATSQAVAKLASAKGLNAPIISTVADIVTGRLSPLDARDKLMARPLTGE